MIRHVFPLFPSNETAIDNKANPVPRETDGGGHPFPGAEKWAASLQLHPAPVFVELVAQGADADPEDLGGMGPVAVRLVKGMENRVFFHLSEGKEPGR
jgi:hypothetical protein